MSEQSVQDVRMVATALSECQEAKGTGIDLLRRGFTSKSLKSHQRQLVDTSGPTYKGAGPSPGIPPTAVGGYFKSGLRFQFQSGSSS